MSDERIELLLDIAAAAVQSVDDGEMLIINPQVVQGLVDALRETSAVVRDIDDGDMQGITAWRDENRDDALLTGPYYEQGQRWRDVNLLLETLGYERAERDVLYAIVRDLAAVAGFDECVFCPAETGQLANHDEACPYRRAREFLASGSPEGDTE